MLIKFSIFLLTLWVAVAQNDEFVNVELSLNETFTHDILEQRTEEMFLDETDGVILGGYDEMGSGGEETPSVSTTGGIVAGELCNRPCLGAVPRACHFRWTLEDYNVLGAACGTCGLPGGNIRDCYRVQCVTTDGVERGVMSINRMIPGPQIHVCKGDMIVVDVVNAMGGTAEAIHWHGFHQRATPWMDGVPYITQCPIAFATTFRYSFWATQAGTQFYHSHAGHHKVNGIYGGIVVRQDPRNDPNSKYYTQDLKEHLIVASDWMRESAEMFFPGLRSKRPGVQPTNVLINGKGTVHNNVTGRSTISVPLEVFRVQRGQRYRFRFVNSMSHVCPVILEVEDHSLLVIASDSYDLQPVAVDSLYSTSGERYDFVINANQSIGLETFWIRLKLVGPCEQNHIQQFAVLTYHTASVRTDVLAAPTRRFTPYPVGLTNANEVQYDSLNAPNTTCGTGDDQNLCITDLASYVRRPDITDVTPDYQFYLGFNNYRQEVGDVFKANNYGHFMQLRDDIVLVGAVNNISFTFPSFNPLTQPENVVDSVFCDAYNLPASCTGSKVCQCVHRLKVKKDAIVELIIVDETPAVGTLNHPFHLHGYELFVVGMGQHPDKLPMTLQLARQMMRARSFHQNPYAQRPIKDTISIPSKGYTVFRFKADNPGWWLLHCHYEWHMAVGMGLVLQVGETWEMPRAPANFPKCNNYQPRIETLFGI